MKVCSLFVIFSARITFRALAGVAQLVECMAYILGEKTENYMAF